MSGGDADEQPQPKGEDGDLLVVVILVGAPGSGKSTFCENVMRAAQRPWTRVCQDTISNGKAGTRQQCIRRASDALKEGKSVFIDRCNLDREQRAEFMKLCGSNVEVHAVVLDLLARLCISRSVKRSGHEGNLQGGKAAAVVNRMLQKKELPKLAEGISRITFCQNEDEVQNAVNMYRNLGPHDRLSSGCFGQKSADSKIQVGIMKFLKRVDPSDNVPCDGNCPRVVTSERVDLSDRDRPEAVTSKEACGEKGICEMDLGCVDVKQDDKEIEEPPEDSHSINTSCDSVPTLAFPSISTSDFQFDRDKASDIIIEAVSSFLKNAPNVRLVLVDLSHSSHILSLVRSKAAKSSIDPKKFLTVKGDITRLFTEKYLRCNVIANAANWRLKPGGGGVNAAIFNAAGEGLEIATRQCSGSLEPGTSVVVPLPPTSPLYQREGVTHVIHVLGPNMNPQRPNYLKIDYDKGCKVLRDAYVALFSNFASIVSGQSNTYPTHRPSSALKESCVADDRQIMSIDLPSKQDDFYKAQRNKKSRGNNDHIEIVHGGNDGNFHDATVSASDAGHSTVTAGGNTQNIDAKEKRTWGSWAQALYRIAMHPEQHKGSTLEISDDYLVLNDLYPKAKRHILVLSRLHGLDCLSDAQKQHLPLLKKMHSVGLRWVEKFSNEDATLIFRFGYHSVPSMRQLHLHVISQDFDSSHLKNKKHWNSFNTAFFRDSVDVIDEIEKYGCASLSDESLLSMELRCHRCRSAHPNIPKLKSHISKCSASMPIHLKNGRLVGAASNASDDC